MNAIAKHQALTHYQEQARIATLEQQRDELASMLKSCAIAIHIECGDSLLLQEARQLLAKLGDKP